MYLVLIASHVTRITTTVTGGAAVQLAYIRTLTNVCEDLDYLLVVCAELLTGLTLQSSEQQ